MKLKKIVIYTLLAVMAATTVSCRYNEGPFLSFRKPDERLVGYWKLKNVYMNGNQIDSTDVLPCQPGSYYAFFTEGMMSVTALKDDIWYESVMGAWAFDDHCKNIEVLFTIKNRKYTYVAEIKRLTRDVLIYEFNDANDDSWRFEFESRSTMYY